MDLQESVECILAANVVMATSFYTTFLDRYPEVQKYFDGVNMERQGTLLTMALVVVEQYHANPYPVTARYLKELGARHRRWNIPKEHFPLFRGALLESLESFHGEGWDEALADQWQTAIDQAAEAMLRGYE